MNHYPSEVLSKVEYAKNIKAKLYVISGDTTVSKAKKEQNVLDFLVSEMDIGRMTSIVLGRNIKKFTTEQVQKFSECYVLFLKDSLKFSVNEAFSVPSKNVKLIERVNRINSSDDEVSFRIKRIKNNKDVVDSILVLTVTKIPSGKFKLINISVDNVDILTGHKSMFDSAMEEGGVNAVFDVLQNF